jgi:ketosteroid isomerase-like protein
MKLRSFFPAGLAASMLLAACSQPCPPAPEHYTNAQYSIPPEIDANIALVQGYLEACIKADENGMRAATDPGYIEHEMFTPVDSMGIDSVVAGYLEIDTLRSDQRISDISADGVRYATGKWAGDWVNFFADYSATDKKTGNPFKIPFFFNAQVKNGKLVRSYLYFDRLSVYNQLGIAPPAAKQQP